MKMFVNILCDPPLGQSTVFPFQTESVDFTILIESSRSLTERPWEVVVWHNFREDGQWVGENLPHDGDNRCVAIRSQGRPAAHRRYFKGVLRLPQNRTHGLKFTVKYRPDPEQIWTWANQNNNLEDGELLVQAKMPDNPWAIFVGLKGTDFRFLRVSSDVPYTRLFNFQYPVPAAGREPGRSFRTFGTVEKQSRFFALARLWTPWLIPQHGKSAFNISKDALVASFLRSDGLHVVMLAVNGVDNVLTVIKSSDQGAVQVHSANDGTTAANAEILVSIGLTHDTALAACVYYARRIVGQFDASLAKEPERDVNMTDDYGAQWYQEWSDGLTYCTWNGLGQDLTEDAILHAMDDFVESGIQITNLIIDDNWQSLDGPDKHAWDRGWDRFEANTAVSPDGLKETVSRIKRRMPRMQTVAVWHALFGYWGGIAASGELAKKYRTKKVKRAAMQMPGLSHPESEITVIDEPDVQRFYDDFYIFLESCGIAGVKTDAQFLLDQLKNPADRRKYIKAYQDAWSISGLRHFQKRRISCMSQVPQIIFHSQLLPDKPPVMARNSDDYYPDAPDSHPWHIFTNSLTSTFTSYLNVIPDWDMFQTLHPYGSYHAAARCLSGGPISFTDTPGRHDMALLDRMTAVTTQGDTVTLRPSRAAKVIESQVYRPYSDRAPLKLGNYSGGKGVGTGFLGVFNLDSNPTSDFVKLTEFPGVEPDQEYVVRAFTTGEVTEPTAGNNSDPLLGFFLPPKGWEILSAHPLLTSSPSPSSPSSSSSTVTATASAGPVVKVASLGLMGKMVGGAANLRFDVEDLPDGRLKMSVIVKALGVLAVYISDLANRTILDNFLITLQRDTIPVSTVSVKPDNPNVLLIDIARAWREMNMHAVWGNEAYVVIYMS